MELWSATAGQPSPIDILSTSSAAFGIVDALTATFAIGLALVHVFAGRLRFLEAIPRSRWLSVAGGVSVAYIFVHLLPEVGAAAAAIDESGTVLATVDRHVYLVTLAGFVVFYGLERFAVIGTDADDATGTETDGGDEPERSPDDVFWVHASSFAAYNALIGYLLVHREEPGVASLTFFFVAMALHFVVNDFGLREHHGRIYHRYGRWLLAAAVLLGATVGYVTPVSEFVLALLLAFLGGGVILNVIKEELPSKRRSRFWAFAVGAAAYTLLLLAA
ncbi:conserved hypothetical protein [Haloterrigena turkmenica DSM 5511]|uniref:Zinc/iron permease n=1 Tax=Haloterrigena turkmenica (strain ATCC 51198 / DSM 5511 / JCM 9101 / NCIMB 13204 / VKM B-1734 / 4k) TaxID=543526 RepID=D2RRB2_HALTV|nr:membrane protein [Haloterrigena turkmenica]ADB60472.1 conserved hypothetical protein [Haloterrigena turkmenica DSM 5511]